MQHRYFKAPPHPPYMHYIIYLCISNVIVNAPGNTGLFIWWLTNVVGSRSRGHPRLWATWMKYCYCYTTSSTLPVFFPLYMFLCPELVPSTWDSNFTIFFFPVFCRFRASASGLTSSPFPPLPGLCPAFRPPSFSLCLYISVSVAPDPTELEGPQGVDKQKSLFTAAQMSKQIFHTHTDPHTLNFEQKYAWTHICTCTQNYIKEFSTHPPQSTFV